VTLPSSNTAGSGGSGGGSSSTPFLLLLGALGLAMTIAINRTAKARI
jgi:hypothetical protein